MALSMQPDKAFELKLLVSLYKDGTCVCFGFHASIEKVWKLEQQSDATFRCIAFSKTYWNG